MTASTMTNWLQSLVRSPRPEVRKIEFVPDPDLDRLKAEATTARHSLRDGVLSIIAGYVQTPDHLKPHLEQATIDRIKMAAGINAGNHHHHHDRADDTGASGHGNVASQRD